MKDRFIKVTFFSLLFFCGLFFISNNVKAATWFISSTGDDTTGNGTSGSPYKTFHKGYTVASSGDTLDMTGTFTFTDTGETGDASNNGYTIGKNLNIVGHGVNQTIIQPATTRAASDRRVFTLSANYTLTITSTTIRYGYGGNSGGCIYANDGSSLTLNYVDMYSCGFGAGYGGAIRSTGNLTINNSSIYSNSNSSANTLGGGIYFAPSSGNLIITNSTISGNSSTGGGSASGGGIYIGSGTATITNSTIAGNYSSSAGGIYAGGTLYLANSIVAGNTIQSGNTYNLYRIGTFNSNGYNIIGPSNSFTTGTLDWTDANNDNTYDLYGTATTGTLNLDTVAHLHDSLTLLHTCAIYTGSVAINNASSTMVNNGVSVPSVDLRGAGRSGTLDIGAFEFDGTGLVAATEPTTQAATTTFSGITRTQMTVGWTNGDGSRRVAFMKQANSGTAEPVDGTRYTANTVFASGQQIDASGWYSIYDGTGSTVTVTGLAASTDYIVQVFEYNGIGTTNQFNYLTSSATNNPKSQASYTSTTIYVNSSTGSDTTGNGTSGSPYKTFTKAYTSYVDSDVFDMVGTFDWNTAGESGDVSNNGYVLNKNIIINGHGPSLTIFQAGTSAGALSERIFTVSAGYSLSITSSTLRYTYGGNSGGCIYAYDGTNVTINYANMYNCGMSSGYGGAIRSTGNLTISNSSIYSNSNSITNQQGGAIYFSTTTGNLIITNTNISANLMTGGSTLGGGIYFGAGTASITNSTITGNSANTDGGGIYQAGGTIFLANTILAGNLLNSVTTDNLYRGSTLTSNGYNVIGGGSNSFTTGTLDWTDANNDGTYDLFGTATTGTLNLDTVAHAHDSNTGITSCAIYTNSIAINNASSTLTNNGVSTPALDVRGAGRSGILDIGAFEFDGTGIVSATEPTTQVSNITSSTVMLTQMTLSWTNGNGSRRAVFMKQDTSGTAAPVDGGRYTASSVFGSGQQIGVSGWYSIYDGTGSTVTVTGITKTTSYIVQVFEYNGIGTTNQFNYLTSSATNNPRVFNTYTSTTIFANSTTGNDSTGNGTSVSPYKTFYKAYSSIVEDDVLDLTGTFSWNNAAETGDSSGSGYTINKNLIINGHGATTTIFQSHTSASSADRRVFTISTGYTLTINSSTIRYGNATNSGGCIHGNDGSSLVLNNSEVTGCLMSGGYGAGIRSSGNVTINSSAIYSNSTSVTNQQGGGIYFATSTGNLFVTNSTIYSNANSGGSSYGGGIYIGSGTATITNSTITGNSAYTGGGGIYESAGTLYMVNTIVGGNSITSGSGRNIYRGGTFTSNGYNIIGQSTSFTTGTLDWTDANNDGTYDLFGTATTGTLGLAASAGLNFSLNWTQNYAPLSTASIAVNTGTSTLSNNGISIPTIDQRGAVTTSTKDIGAHEYRGLFSIFYPVTYSAVANGSISGSSTQSVMHSFESVAVTAVPDSGYRFSSWSDGSTSTSRTDSGVSTTLAFSASFVIDTVTLSYTAGAHGSITGSSTQIISYGGNGAQVTAAPDTGYYFSNWSDGVLTAARTDTNVLVNKSVTVSFTATTNTISYIAGAHGSITGSSTQIISYGGNGAQVTAAPDTGYSFVSWSDGRLTAARTDTNVTSSTSYTASFAINNYTLSYTAGAGGSLTGSTTQSVAYGGNGGAITAVADVGYNFYNWSDASVANPRTDTNVSSNISVTANFSGATNVLRYVAGTGGAISGSSTQVIAYGGNGTQVIAVPDTGYSFVSWNDSVTTTARTDTNVIVGATYTASFATNTYSLSYITGAGGTISGSASQAVAHGGSGTAVTAVPDTGYSFVNWSDGSTSTSRTDTNVTSTRSYTATFLINTYTLSYAAGAHGSLTGSTTQRISYGGSGGAVTAVPDNNYYFINWSDASVANPRTDINASGNINVTANFDLNRTLYVDSSSGNDVAGNGTSGSPYKTFNKAYTMAISGDTIDLTGTFTWTDPDEAGGNVAINGFIITKNLTIQGHNADATIIQAAASDNIASRRVFTIPGGYTVTIKDLAIRYGKISGSGYDGGGIRNSGVLTISNCEVYANRTLADSGGGISNRNILNVVSSTIYNNQALYMGGGISNSYYVADAGRLTITNSTIVFNQTMSAVGYIDGGGVQIRRGNATVTNSTIAYNTACGVGGLGMDTSTSSLTIKNTIIAKNSQMVHSYCNDGLYPTDFGFYFGMVDTVNDNGNNIIGFSRNYVWTGNGDWTDAVNTSTVSTNRDGIYKLYSSSTTGVVGLDSVLSLNNNTNKTRTIALQAGSIAINNGGTGQNGTVSVPATDQRGKARSGTTDIGSFEYGNFQADTTPPVISNVSAVADTNSVVITWTTNKLSSSQVKYDANTYCSTESDIYNSSVPVTSHSVSLSSLIACTKYYYVVASRDASGNFAIKQDNFFYTTGCTGNATISDVTEAAFEPNVTTTISHAMGGRTLGMTIPTTFNSYPTDFQIKNLTAAEVMQTLSRPTNRNIIGDKVTDIKALADPETTVTSTSAAVTMTMDYTDSDIVGIEESSLQIYSSTDGGEWEPLDNCVVDTSAKTVTCDTSHFSVFGLFGAESAGGDSEGSSSDNTIVGAGVFAAPSAPQVSAAPQMVNGRLSFAVDNVIQMAFSERKDFAGSSWQKYNAEYFNDHKCSGVIYIKFRSHDGGESAVYEMNCDEKGQTVARKYTFKRDLKRGMSGADVKELQKFLNINGFTVAKAGAGSKGKETNYFGPGLQAALVKYQKVHKIIPSSGYFGVKTRKFLLSL